MMNWKSHPTGSLSVTVGSALLGLLLTFWVASPSDARAGDRVGAERCGECHKKEFKAWNRTTHSVVLSDRDDDTVQEKLETIPEAMGIDDIEVDQNCSGCHFSYYVDNEGEEQLTSVDCESCHGAGAGWIDIHSDYGSKGGAPIENAEDEDPAHRAMRLKEAKAGGWLRPGEIVLVARNCLNCHTGPSEKVVNQGGHTPGSKFELVSWLSGEVRHNFHRTKQGANGEIPPARKRQLYVVGRALDYEYALRGLSKSTTEGDYSKAMIARVNAAKGHLEAINAKASIPEVSAVLKAGSAVALKPNNKAQLTAAADAIQKAARAFADKHDGSKLAAIDSLIPKGAKGQSYSGG